MTDKGYDFFKKQDLKEYEDAPYALQLIVQTPGVLGVLDGLNRAAGGDGIDDKIENGKLKLSGRTVQLINEFFPIMRLLNEGIYGATLIPGLEEALENATGVEDNYDKLEQILRFLGYSTGIKFYPLDTKEAEMQRQRDIYYDAERERTADTRSTPEGMARSMQYRESMDDRIRRLVGGI
jgi:hypothetical protein